MTLLQEVRQRNVAVLLFDDVEVLDFAGPFEVFSVCGRRHQLEPFAVHTVSERGQPISARNGLVVQPSHSFVTCPAPDVLVVPGGFGTRQQMHNVVLLEWISGHARSAEFVLSVCTGALILGAAGLLNGLHATTHFMAFDELRAVAPNALIDPSLRVAVNDGVILSAGISAGIDMSLRAVSAMLGDDLARETARYMEYEGRWERTRRSE